jgi:hypothetical protein
LGHGLTLIFLCFVVIFIAVLIDFSAGYKAAKVCKEPIKSRLLRRTVSKVTDYYHFLIVGVLVDVLGLAFPWYSIPFAAVIVSISVVMIEGWSVIEKFKKMKSSAADIPKMAQRIVDVKNITDAVELIGEVKELANRIGDYEAIKRSEK